MNEDLNQLIYDYCASDVNACRLFRSMGLNTTEDVIEFMSQYRNVLLDEDVFRNAYANEVISDYTQKHVKELADKEKLTEDDVAFLLRYADNVDGLDDTLPDDMLDKYAEHLKNYLYTYKESATQVDPSIDPSEKHIGPMAQDIEQVAPDCVKETEEGVKVVDGSRLALVNAGVIGDIARRLERIEEALNVRGN